MARHSGKNAKVKIGSTFLDGVMGFDLEEKADTVKLTAAGDDWDEHVATQRNWSGSITLRLDHEAAANQTPRAGDSATFEGYTEGDGTGKVYYSGTVIFTGNAQNVTYDGEAGRKYDFLGTGTLTKATVGA